MSQNDVLTAWDPQELTLGYIWRAESNLTVMKASDIESIVGFRSCRKAIHSSHYASFASAVSTVEYREVCRLSYEDVYYAVAYHSKSV